VLDHDQDVEAAEHDGVDVGEADREDRVGLRGEELSPGRSEPERGGIDASGLQDSPEVEAATGRPIPTNSPWMRR
jgi:hypothetical protein